MLFLKDKKKEESLIIFKVYVPFNKKYFTYSTGVSIKTSEWNHITNLPFQKRGETGKVNARITAIINNYTHLYQKIINELNIEVTKDLLKSKFDEHFNKNKKNILAEDVYPSDMFNSFILEKELSKINDSKTINYYKIHFKVFKEFENATKKYIFEEINEDLFPVYLKYLREERNYQDSSLHRHLGMLRTFWEWAFKKERKVNSFNCFTYKNRSSDKLALSEKDLNILENLELKNEKLTFARDVFLIGCYSGQRFSDYSIFESADIRNGMIVKFSEKTEIQAYIPLHRKLKILLEKYNYKIPKFKKVADFNELIRNVCKIAEFKEKIKMIKYRGNKKEVEVYERWELITSHAARSTFITISTMKGMPDRVIMDITGIKDTSTLYKYKRISVDDIQSAIKVWE
ncbi:tyrosine-type recombinase/integrase [Chryseobacterium sp. DT-3]|uniref:tyrosine-type recombinase/integrase n=1 Tax=Chryseobacterium sp. DT-3 TaxID=3396164 RepID=UPI003F1BC526